MDTVRPQGGIGQSPVDNQLYSTAAKRWRKWRVGMGFGCKIWPTGQTVWISIIKHHRDFSDIRSYSFNCYDVCAVIICTAFSSQHITAECGI